MQDVLQFLIHGVIDMGCCFSDPIVEPVPTGTAYAVRCEPMYQVPQGYGQQIIMQGQAQAQAQAQSQIYDPYQPHAYVHQPQVIAYQQAQPQAIAYQQPQPQAIAYYPYQQTQYQGNI